MRSFLILPLSAALLGGCLTSQENPNYEHSTTYRGDQAGQNQYASAAPAAPSSVSYEQTLADYEQAVASYEGAQTQTLTQTQPETIQANSVATTVIAIAPTDSAYGTRTVSGTPGFMAMESARQAVALEATAETMPAAQIATVAPLGSGGTPISYDISRNLVQADAVTTGQQLPDTVRVIGLSGQTAGAGQNYTVQQGDTVYSLSRRTCVGVNVIQSMNGLSNDFAIKIGQPLTLPSSVC